MRKLIYAAQTLAYLWVIISLIVILLANEHPILAGIVFAWMFIYHSRFEWKRLEDFCWWFGHHWWFCISFPTLKSGEVWCIRCGKVECHTDKPAVRG